MRFSFRPPLVYCPSFSINPLAEKQKLIHVHTHSTQITQYLQGFTRVTPQDPELINATLLNLINTKACHV